LDILRFIARAFSISLERLPLSLPPHGDRVRSIQRVSQPRPLRRTFVPLEDEHTLAESHLRFSARLP
jgi:hypothetical protein